MSLQHRRVLIVVLTLEFALGAVASGWRLTRPAYPEANLDRLPVSTAADIRQLQQQVRTDRPAAWTRLGQAYLAYGYFPQAEACLKRAATLAPRSFATVYGQAYSLERMGRLPEAEAQFRTAAETDTRRTGRELLVSHWRLSPSSRRSTAGRTSVLAGGRPLRTRGACAGQVANPIRKQFRSPETD